METHKKAERGTVEAGICGQKESVCSMFFQCREKKDHLVRIEQARLGTGSTLAQEREEKQYLKTKSIHEQGAVGRGSSSPSGTTVEQEDNHRYARGNGISYLIPKITVSFNSAELVADGGLDCIMNFQNILFVQGFYKWCFSTC